MAEVKGIVESLSKIYQSPKELLIRMNEIIYKTFDKKTFITLIYSIIDMNKQTITFSRAGHCPLIYYNQKKNQAQFIEPRGIGLGLEKGIVFEKNIEEESFSLQPNDLLLYYTDGVVEANNINRKEFGEQHLLDITFQYTSLTSTQLKTKLVQHVKTFSGAAKPHDDLTMVVVKVG